MNFARTLINPAFVDLVYFVPCGVLFLMEARYVLCGVRTEYSYISAINPRKILNGRMYSFPPVRTDSAASHFIDTVLYIIVTGGSFKPRFDSYAYMELCSARFETVISNEA
jgi:hypothetical protein